MKKIFYLKSFVFLSLFISFFYISSKPLLAGSCVCNASSTGKNLSVVSSNVGQMRCSNIKCGVEDKGTLKDIEYNVNNCDKVTTRVINCSWESSNSSNFSPSNNKNLKKTKLQNPLQYDSVPGIIGGVIKTALGIVGSLALLAFVVGAGRWLISAGKSDQIKKGAQTMLYAVIGVFVVLASYGILNLVLETFVN